MVPFFRCTHRSGDVLCRCHSASLDELGSSADTMGVAQNSPRFLAQTDSPRNSFTLSENSVDRLKDDILITSGASQAIGLDLATYGASLKSATSGTSVGVMQRQRESSLSRSNVDVSKGRFGGDVETVLRRRRSLSVAERNALTINALFGGAPTDALRKRSEIVANHLAISSKALNAKDEMDEGRDAVEMDSEQERQIVAKNGRLEVDIAAVMHGRLSESSRSAIFGLSHTAGIDNFADHSVLHKMQRDYVLSASASGRASEHGSLVAANGDGPSGLSLEVDANSRVGSFVSYLSPSATYLTVSEEVESVLGLHPSQLCGLSLYQLVHPDDCEKIAAHHSTLLGPYSDPSSQTNNVTWQDSSIGTRVAEHDALMGGNAIATEALRPSPYNSASHTASHLVNAPSFSFGLRHLTRSGDYCPVEAFVTVVRDAQSSMAVGIRQVISLVDVRQSSSAVCPGLRVDSTVLAATSRFGVPGVQPGSAVIGAFRRDFDLVAGLSSMSPGGALRFVAADHGYSATDETEFMTEFMNE
eukprot:Opistho-2@26394